MSEGLFIKMNPSIQRKVLFQRKSTLRFKCQMVKRIVPVWALHIEDFMPGLHTAAGVKRPGMALCMPKNRWTGIKAVMLGYFTPEVVCQVAKCISKSLRVFRFAWAEPRYNSQISTLRRAGLSRPENRRGVSHEISQGFGEFCLGSFPIQDSACDGLTSVSRDKKHHKRNAFWLNTNSFLIQERLLCQGPAPVTHLHYNQHIIFVIVSYDINLWNFEISVYYGQFTIISIKLSGNIPYLCVMPTQRYWMWPNPFTNSFVGYLAQWQNTIFYPSQATPFMGEHYLLCH